MTDAAQTQPTTWPRVEARQLDNSNRWCVINPSGDAELGNWKIAECFWESDARRIADALNADLPAVMKAPSLEIDSREKLAQWIYNDYGGTWPPPSAYLKIWYDKADALLSSGIFQMKAPETEGDEDERGGDPTHNEERLWPQEYQDALVGLTIGSLHGDPLRVLTANDSAAILYQLHRATGGRSLPPAVPTDADAEVEEIASWLENNYSVPMPPGIKSITTEHTRAIFVEGAKALVRRLKAPEVTRTSNSNVVPRTAPPGGAYEYSAQDKAGVAAATLPTVESIAKAAYESLYVDKWEDDDPDEHYREQCMTAAKAVHALLDPAK